MDPMKIILIDGNSLVYRAFFALPATLTTSTGQVTNAAYGFTSMLIRLLKDEKPDIVIVAFDKGRPHRLAMYEAYKAHRPKTPDDLRSQFPLVRDILQSLRIPVVEVEGYEADDVLATLAKRLEKDHQVIIVTGDRDALQLISPSVTVLATKRGITDMKRYDRHGVIERFGVPPEKMADLLGLKGDASDNIPGVPGVGEKTAAKLIQEFGSLEEVLDNIDRIESKRFREIIRNNVDIARLSKDLAVLEEDIPIDLDLNTCGWGNWDRAEVKNAFASLEFDTLSERLFQEETKKAPMEETTLELTIRKLESIQDLNHLVGVLERTNSLGVEADIGGSYPVDLKLRGLAFAPGEPDCDIYFISFKGKESKLPRAVALQYLRPFFERGDCEVAVFGGKEKTLCLRNEGLNFRSLSFDCEIAAYLLESSKTHCLKDLAKDYLGISLQSLDEEELVCHGAYVLRQLKSKLEEKLKKDGLWRLFEEVEMPLISVLANMEWNGVGIDADSLEFLDSEVDGELRSLEAEIYSLAGEEFNINSSQQLGSILFEKLGLETNKKTKTGFSTDASVLMKLIDRHPIIEKILRYRELAKLKSTYIDALPRLINPKTGRLHTTFSQVGTTTGRLSSSNPNLQNIPVRTDLGRRVREAFVPARKTDEFLVADYSQIELRILAGFSESESLIQAFENDEDIHRATASEVFGVEPEVVDSEMRRRAKAVNFGIVYGISPVGLSEQLGIGKDEAGAYIDNYFQKYPKVREFIDQTVADAYAKGFVATIMGRRRYIPELKSGNYKIRSLGERLAINTRIQGSAADVIKIAMIKLDKALESQGLQTKMILQVHDELVFEVPPMEREMVIDLVKECMEEAFPLTPRLKVDIALGSNWREAK